MACISDGRSLNKSKKLWTLENVVIENIPIVSISLLALVFSNAFSRSVGLAFCSIDPSNRDNNKMVVVNSVTSIGISQRKAGVFLLPFRPNFLPKLGQKGLVLRC